MVSRFVCSRAEASGQITRFATYRSPRGPDHLLSTVKIWEACRATSAAPSFFDPIKIGGFGESFIDGGIGANNPIYELWNEAQGVWPGGSLEDKVECLISIGTGMPSLHSFGRQIPKILKSFAKIATDTKDVANKFYDDKAKLVGEKRYYRFNVQHGLEKIGLEESSKISSIASVTAAYIASGPVYGQIKACAEIITKGLSDDGIGTFSPPETSGLTAAPQIEPVLREQRHKLLTSLRSDDVNANARQADVLQNYEETFQWIFNDNIHPWHSFYRWIQTEGGIYWINGKLGSGKSTLMKFILENPKTKDCLKVWGSSDDYLILSFFFWRAAKSPLQKNLRGLLCALLHQLCLESADVLSHVLKLPIIRNKFAESDWSIKELFDILLEGLNKTSRPVFILLDGLDELPSSDEVEELLKKVKQLSSIRGVKLCVSSRPEQSFITAFSSCPQLRLQDLTAADIRKFVTSSLHDIIERADDRAEAEKELSQIANLVIEKAAGVFLVSLDTLHLVDLCSCYFIMIPGCYELISNS